MKSRISNLKFLVFLLPSIGLGGNASAQGIGVLDQDLYSAFATVMDLSGAPPADTAWPGYRLLDANGVMRVLSDVTGPSAPGEQFSTSSKIVWSDLGNVAKEFRIQTRYADFGATCDLNNPSTYDRNVAGNISVNYGNGLGSSVYQSGHYSTCDGNDHFSQNNFSPLPLITRSAWLYRACRRIGANATSAQIALMVERLRVPDPTPTPVPGPGSLVLEQATYSNFDNTLPTPNPSLTYNWCSRITAPLESDYQAIFRAFYPGRNIPQVIDATRSQVLSPTRSTSLGKPVSGTAALLSFNPGKDAQAQIFLNPGSTTPKFREKLMELVSTSDAYINGLPQTGTLGWQNMEDKCLPTTGAPSPNLEQVKAAAAWRALLITLCMDPGWQVL